MLTVSLQPRSKIRDTLNNLILKVTCPAAHTREQPHDHITYISTRTDSVPSCSQSPQSWQTSVGLPFFQITGTVVEWDE